MAKFRSGPAGPRIAASNVKMPFGKYGKNSDDPRTIGELPDEYLMWCIDNLEDHTSLYHLLEQEYEMRFQPKHVGAMDPEMRDLLPDFIRLGFKSLAHRVHPDKGGTNEQMRALTRLKEFLEGL